MRFLQQQKARYAVLIDPDEQKSAPLSPLLDWLNYLVFSFADPADAVSATTVVRPDVIIVSMDVSERSIQDCMHHLRQGACTAAVPVIGTINGDDMALKLRCFEHGAIGYLRHPVEVDALYNALQVATEKYPRFGMRIPADLPAGLAGASGTRRCKTRILDLSERGAFLRTDEPDPDGADVFVEFNVAGKDIRTRARIRHSGGTGIGIQYTGISCADQAHIRHYVMHEVLKEVSLRAGYRQSSSV